MNKKITNKIFKVMLIFLILDFSTTLIALNQDFTENNIFIVSIINSINNIFWGLLIWMLIVILVFLLAKEILYKHKLYTEYNVLLIIYISTLFRTVMGNLFFILKLA